jgi:photosystem II stability/assembly factor-like uncharacterized protein
MRIRGLVLAILLIGLSVVFLAAAPQTVAHADDPHNKAQQAAADSGPVWVKTGGPLGGIGYDIRSRPDNPDVLLVTDNARGVHISVDNGQTWNESNTGIDVRAGDGYPIFSLTVDPRNNNIVWAGTQIRVGIFKSTDGGHTWVRKTNGIAGDMGVIFRGFTVDPTNSDIVYAAGEIASFAWNNGVPLEGNGSDLTKGMVYKTTDGGEHWTQIWYGDNLARYVWVDPRNTKVLYVSTGIFDRLAANSDAVANIAGGVGILKSTDAGQTWRVLNQSNGLGNLYVGSLFMHPTNPDILLAGTGHAFFGVGSGVYLTTDGGETWTKTLSDGKPGPPEDGFAFGAVEISTSSPHVCYAIAGSVYRSDDGCRTWNRYFTDYNILGQPSAGVFWGPPGMRAGFPIDLQADLRDPMRVWANMYGGGNFLSTDGGKTWANASRGYTAAAMRSVAIDPTDPAIVYGVAGSGAFKSTDGGRDWEGVNWQPATMSEKSTIVVSPSNPREVLLSDSYTGKLMKSVNGAQSWGMVLDYGDGIGAIQVIDLRKRNQGFASIAYAPSNGRVVYAGMAISNCEAISACGIPTYQGVHRSTDGGTTWEVTAGDGLGSGSILALAVHPTNPDIVYAGTGAPGLFKTENGGRTWVAINQGLSSLYVRSVAIDPSSPNTVYVGTAGAAVFKSSNGGASWQASSAGLVPNDDIWALSMDPTNSSILWAGSKWNGAYRSVDAGATWVQFNTGLNTRMVIGMAISDDGGTVYAGTVGEGVFRLDLPVVPKVRSHPSSTRVAVGTQVSFAAAASGTPTPIVQWQVSTNSGSTFTNIGGATATTYAFAAVAADTGKQFRAVFTNSLGTATSNAATLTVLPTTALDRTALVFSALTSGAAFTAQTSAQTVRLTQTGAGSMTWTATSNKPWLTVTPASGSGSAALSIAVKFDSSVAAAGTATGTITLALTGAANSVGPVNVTLTVMSSTAAASGPFGSFDTPAGDTTVLAGSIAVTGWTLDNIGVRRVELWRDLQAGETTAPFASTPSDPRNGKIFIANATFADGARPDVEALYPTTPANYRAGWGYLMLTWGLFGQGNGTYKFYAFGVDQEGNTATIGTKTVVISNNTATKPFGSIDTPGIGGDASGPNFGWGLTPKVNGVATCKIQPSGVQVSIDSGPLQPVVYGDARTDIAGAFPGFSNTAAAGGHFIFDWSTLANGAHTIGWLITDDCNRADGVGSRFFNVTGGTSQTSAATAHVSAVAEGQSESTAAITVARGYGELPEIVTPDKAGSRTIELKQGGRIEIRVPHGFESAYQLGTGGERRALPTGVTWDAASGIFYWQPAPAFLGRYRIVFSNGSERISVRVVVTP